jgi:hypothetical protein
MAASLRTLSSVRIRISEYGAAVLTVTPQFPEIVVSIDVCLTVMRYVV